MFPDLRALACESKIAGKFAIVVFKSTVALMGRVLFPGWSTTL